MKRSQIVTGLIAALAGVGVTAGLAPAPATQPSPEIKALIAQLSSPDEATRTAAREKLVGMGDDARAALEAFVHSKSAAEAALAQIDTNAVAEPTLITLNMKNADAEAVFTALARQSRYDIELFNQGGWNPANLPKISITADQRPFWEVFREACSQAGLSLVNTGDDQRIFRLSPVRPGRHDMMKCPCSIDKSFLLAATSLAGSGSVDLSHPENNRSTLSMQMTMLVEPKVRVIRYAAQPDIDEVVDNKGNSLKPDANYSRGYGMLRGIGGAMVVALKCPANAGDRIASFRGKVRLTVQTRSEMLQMPDIVKARWVSKSVGGLKVTIKNVARKSAYQYRVDALFTRTTMKEAVFSQLLQTPSLRLVDADGHEYRYSGHSGGLTHGGGSYDVSMSFTRGNTDAGEPVKLVWVVPTDIQEIAVPFTFSDLPLP